MSLKAFHIFFIGLSTLMCLGIAAWRLAAYSEEGQIGILVQAVASGGAGVGLVEYGRRFLKKTKELGYL